ncbi:MAG: ABC transporter substrate-binding protein [Bryobacterales bacterium]|nr:ABC transporter substrate-binding protein [Bryobacterales bacterium]
MAIVGVGCSIGFLVAQESEGPPGVGDHSIRFGQIACFSGPNAHLGVRYRAGIIAAFREINEQGGVHGRTLELEGFDDGYEPTRAAENAERVVAQNDVVAVIGGVGTPTARRIAPILRDAQIPFIGMFTGADFLRDIDRFPNTVNLRASYNDEVVLLVDHMVNGLGKRRFGVIYQDDAFGRSVLAHYRSALAEFNLPVLAKSTFTRNTHAVHSSLFTLSKADLDAVLMVGSYSANADVVNLWHSLDHEYVLANLSFVGSHDLRESVRGLDEGSANLILVSEVVPDVGDASWEVVQHFLRAIARVPADGELREGIVGLQSSHFNESIALEGYIIGRFVIEVLQRLEGEPTREALLATALQPEPVQIEDWTIKVAPGTNWGSRYVRLTNLSGEKLAEAGLQ